MRIEIFHWRGSLADLTKLNDSYALYIGDNSLWAQVILERVSISTQSTIYTLQLFLGIGNDEFVVIDFGDKAYTEPRTWFKSMIKDTDLTGRYLWEAINPILIDDVNPDGESVFKGIQLALEEKGLTNLYSSHKAFLPYAVWNEIDYGFSRMKRINDGPLGDIYRAYGRPEKYPLLGWEEVRKFTWNFTTLGRIIMGVSEIIPKGTIK